MFMKKYFLKWTIKGFVMLILAESVPYQQANAQTWMGSGINTHTMDWVGIGFSPASKNADFEIVNRTYPSHPPGPFTSNDFPASKISRKCYMSGSTLGAPPSNIFEIWYQNFDEATLVPLGNNNLAFIVDNYGRVGINTVLPSATLDVTGTGAISADLSVGNDLTVQNNVGVTNNLNVAHDANISSSLTVSGPTILGGQLSVSAPADLLSLTVNSLSTGSSGPKSLPILDKWGAFTKESIPALSLTGSNLTLSNGGTISSTVSLPSSADNLGNHTATVNLNMNGKDIVSAYNITSTNNINANNITTNNIKTKNIDLMNGLVIGAVLNIASGFGGSFVQCTAPIGLGSAASSAGYDLTTAHNILVNGVSITSDKRLKDNITHLKGIKEKVLSLNAYSYNYNQEAVKDLKYDGNKKHIGFLAQEVQAQFPNLTPVIDEKGHMAIDYMEMIPLLLETIKEEDAIIASQGAAIRSLESSLASLKLEIEALKNNTPASFNENKGGGTTTSSLSQNVPNPFGKETVIEFSIKETFDQAFIGIYNLNGQQLKKISIQKGQSQAIVNGEEFEAGMYVYSLVVNSRLIDSKRMVISK